MTAYAMCPWCLDDGWDDDFLSCEECNGWGYLDEGDRLDEREWVDVE